ncbi:hypothetical protein [Halobaculum magnesiiphilum]|uniref:Uncharacterized protein n=1 Tax=Halobaculum magnesiiphilum TaxID=1017351 RepID=A0A8T8WB87_9EURY|nr:hypothetical protein [Halobaculum magnesiiphilum]QZP37100.1 hypothetical protein K6T50_12480 [Halobaculum magnesiiphilum]
MSVPIVTVGDADNYSDGAFRGCTDPDCDGDLYYERDDVLVCRGCGTQFSHSYDHTGENVLERIDVADDGSIETAVVARVYDPADEVEGWREVVDGADRVETDGGEQR